MSTSNKIKCESIGCYGIESEKNRSTYKHVVNNCEDKREKAYIRTKPSMILIICIKLSIELILLTIIVVLISFIDLILTDKRKEIVT